MGRSWRSNRNQLRHAVGRWLSIGIRVHLLLAVAWFVGSWPLGYGLHSGAGRAETPAPGLLLRPHDGRCAQLICCLLGKQESSPQTASSPRPLKSVLSHEGIESEMRHLPCSISYRKRLGASPSFGRPVPPSQVFRFCSSCQSRLSRRLLRHRGACKIEAAVSKPSQQMCVNSSLWRTSESLAPQIESAVPSWDTRSRT